MNRLPAFALLALLLPASAPAQVPEPIDPVLFAFPGTIIHPASAVSAGLALADQWIGDEPFHNPATAGARRLYVSPAFLRVSRQDLRADHRNFDEQPGFFDGAGASIGLPLAAVTLSLYAFQPVLRLEDNAFERGERGGPTPPAVVQSASTVREVRAGLGASFALRPTFRAGVAAEWTRRSDDYEIHEQSGSPDAGDRLVSFSGSGVGFQGGVRWQTPELFGGPLSVGIAARMLPELEMEGKQTLATPLRDTIATVAALLESGFEGGLSIGYSPSRALGLIAGLGWQSARDWSFGVTSERATLWSLGFEYHDPEEPWTVRAGYGQEQRDEAPEPRAGLIGLGFSWAAEGWGLDLGVLHRSIEREDHPTSFDDRVVATLRFDL